MYGCFSHAGDSDMNEVIKCLNKGVGVCPGNIFIGGAPQSTSFVRIHCGVSSDKAQDVASRLKKA